MFEACRRLADSARFQSFILVVILFNSVLVGAETFESLQPYVHTLELINAVVLGIFVFEIAVRFLAVGPRFASFFLHGWNLFDLSVVLVSFLPAVGPLGTVARLARVLRVARLIEFSPKLRLVIDTMLRSIPSLGHVVLLLGILMYIYAIVGHHLFKDINEETAKTWGSLGASLWTMFQTLTFENWVAVQQPIVEHDPLAALFFISFLLLAAFTGLNLFIALIMNNLDEVRAEHAQEKAALAGEVGIGERIAKLKVQLDELQAMVERRATP